jgi:putative copper export protein
MEQIAIMHLIFVAFWFGVMAAETIIELYSKKRRELHTSTVRFHYWIDLLVELPVVLGVLILGIILVIMVKEITILHIVKICLGLVAIGINLFCIYVVVKRMNMLKNEEKEDNLWNSSKMVERLGKVGIPIGVVVAVLGLYLGYCRMMN